MTRLLRAALLLAPLALAPLCAQQTPTDEHTAPVGHGVCGNALWNLTMEDGLRAAENTRRNNPQLYRQMQKRAKDRARTTFRVTDEYDFSVYNGVTQMYDQQHFVLNYQGIRAKIWVDDAIKNKVSTANMARFMRALDSSTAPLSRDPYKGIITNDTIVFGDPPHPAYDDGYIHFLITDIKDGLSGGNYVAGYFFPHDQIDPAVDPTSNGLNMLYVDILAFNDTTEALNTMAHEFQHNVHYNTYRESESFYNEGCSEEASILCGYANRSNANYLSNTNVPLLRWTTQAQDPGGNIILADYSRAMTFTHYLKDQFGDPFFRQLTYTRLDGMDRLDRALMTYGRSEHWQDVLKGFAVANYVVKNYPDSRYVYQQPLLGTYNASTNTVTRVPSASKLVDNTTANYTAANFPTSGQIQLNGFGLGYSSYSGNAMTGGGLRATFTWSGDAAVFAILFRDKDVVEVRELNKGEAAELVQSQQYTKIAFAMVNLRVGGNDAVISWTMEPLVSGVDVATDARTLSIAAITPNPAHENATLNLTAVRGGEVKVEVYDGAGALVMEQTVNAQAGHATVTLPTTALPSGAYLVRLRQGEASATRSLVVAH